MTQLAIVSTTIGGAVVGGVIGALTVRDGGDFDMGPLIGLVYGGFIGGLAGVIVGSAVFA